MSQPLSPGSQLERGLKSLQRIASTGVMGKDALDTAQKDLFAEFTKRNFENEQSLRPPPSIPPTVASIYKGGLTGLSVTSVRKYWGRAYYIQFII